MKRLTVAAAALAAGMLTIVAQSQAQSDRDLFHNTVGKVAAADRKAEKPVAKKLAAKEPKRFAGLAKTKTIKASKAKASKAKAREVESQGILASIPRRPRRSRRVRGSTSRRPHA